MAEDIINTFIKGFTKFQEDDQLKRAKDTEKDFRKMNDATLIWVKDCCERILTERKSLSTSQSEGTELSSHGSSADSPKVCPQCNNTKKCLVVDNHQEVFRKCAMCIEGKPS